MLRRKNPTKTKTSMMICERHGRSGRLCLLSFPSSFFICLLHVDVYAWHGLACTIPSWPFCASIFVAVLAGMHVYVRFEVFLFVHHLALSACLEVSSSSVIYKCGVAMCARWDGDGVRSNQRREDY
jgi:hypothetical protein